jgi:para-aminobenzoate synthetase
MGAMTEDSFMLSYSLKTKTVTEHRLNSILYFALKETFLSYASSKLPFMEIKADFPFKTGYVGYVGYEMKNETLLDYSAVYSGNEADACLLFCTEMMVLDHQKKIIYLTQKKSSGWCDSIQSQLNQASFAHKPIPPSLNLHFQSIDKVDYTKKINQCQKSIRLGDTYEVCLTTQIIADHTTADPFNDAWNSYRRLRNNNSAPYASFFHFTFPSRELCICSSSPERFLKTKKQGNDWNVSMKPIKGTRKRDSDPQKDQQIAFELANSIKDRAENLMVKKIK